MADDITLTCRCGSFRAAIRGADGESGNHAMCYCVDCRAFIRHLGREAEFLDESGGTELYQTQPHRMTVVRGREHLAVLRLSEKGLHRWYARCCGTPVGNTMGTPKAAFVGVMVGAMAPVPDTLGPVVFRYRTDQATGPVAGDRGSIARFALRTLGRIARARLDGTWRETPFFDAATGRSVAEPHVLTEAERARAYAE